MHTILRQVRDAVVRAGEHAEAAAAQYQLDVDAVNAGLQQVQQEATARIERLHRELTKLTLRLKGTARPEVPTQVDLLALAATALAAPTSLADADSATGRAGPRGRETGRQSGTSLPRPPPPATTPQRTTPPVHWTAGAEEGGGTVASSADEPTLAHGGTTCPLGGGDAAAHAPVEVHAGGGVAVASLPAEYALPRRSDESSAL